MARRGLGTILVVMAMLLLAGAARAATPPPPCEGDPTWSNGVQPRFTLALDPGTQWQPSTGFYRVTVHGQGVADINKVRVCLRWLGAQAWQLGRELRLESANLTDAVYTVRVPPGLAPPPGNDYVVSGLIAHVAQLRVELRDKNDNLLFDEALRIGVTWSGWGYIAGLGAVVLVLAFLLVSSRNAPGGFGLLAIIARSDGTASLSQFQILLWSLVIGGSAIHVMVISGTLLQISQGTLVLLGIAGTAVLGANFSAARDAGAAAKPAVAPPPVVPRWSDLVVTARGAEIDITRVQMLFFTVVSAGFVLLTVAERQIVPDIPVEYLTLMGISNGVYLTAKFVPRA